jgi:tetratricopeptide (TPR) repeat protein
MSEILSLEKIAQEAKSHYKSGDYQTAAKSFEAARQGYLSKNDHLKAAEMANNASVALLQAGEFEASLSALDGIEDIFKDTGDRKRQAMTLGNQAAALEALNRLDEAERIYWQAEKIFKEIGETDLRLPIMQSISKLQLRTGRQLQAVASMYAGVEDIKKPTLKQRFLKRCLGIPMRILDQQMNELPDGSNDNT